MNSWSNDELARLLRPQQPLVTTEPPKPPRPKLATMPVQAPRPVDDEMTEPAPSSPPSPPALRSVPAGPGSVNNAKAPSTLSQQEIDALMRSLNRGTETRLRRQATPEELQRLVNAINSARRLELLAVEAMFGGASIYWSGSDWIFERPPREQRAA
jgi:hypothetical protein